MYKQSTTTNTSPKKQKWWKDAVLGQSVLFIESGKPATEIKFDLNATNMGCVPLLNKKIKLKAKKSLHYVSDRKQQRK